MSLTAAQVKDLITSLWTRAGSNRVDDADLRTVGNAIVDMVAALDVDIFPDWTNALTFQTDGSDNGKYCKHPDSTGKKRIWETKTDDNLNNEPPTDPLITSNTDWQEISQSAKSGIVEYAPGVFGEGLIIVFWNHSVDGNNLYKLVEPVRPFNSANIETEITAGQWEKIPLKTEGHYRGLFTSLANLESALPTANPGDFADVDPGSGTDLKRYAWDEDEGWVPVGGGGSLSGLTAATGTNTINNAAYAQEWQWNTLGAGTGLKLSSTSTAAASSTQALFEVNQSGANASSGETTYAGKFINTKTGTSSTNVGLYAKASGGTNNIPLLIQAGGTTTNKAVILNNSSGTEVFSIQDQGSATWTYGIRTTVIGGGSIKLESHLAVLYLLTYSSHIGLSQGGALGWSLFGDNTQNSSTVFGANIVTGDFNFYAGRSGTPVGNSLLVYGGLGRENSTINYERGRFGWNSNTLEIGTEAGGTGTLRGVTFKGSNFLFGGTTITAGSVLADFQSTDKGVVFPNVTNIASVTTPAKGMIVYDAATNKFNFRENTSWVQLGGSGIGGSTGSTDNAILRADGTGGNTAQSSIVSITDTGDISIGNVSTAGDRNISVLSSDTDARLILSAQGDGAVSINSTFGIILGDSSTNNTQRSIGVDLSTIDTDLALHSTGRIDFVTQSKTLAMYSYGLLIPGAYGIITGGDFTINTDENGSVGATTGKITLLTGTPAVNFNSESIYLNTGGASGTGKEGNIGLFTTSVADWKSMEKGMFIGNVTTEPTAALANGIAAYSKDSSDGSVNSTLALYLEQAVEAIGTFTASHKLKIWLNGVEYWIQLDAV